MVLLCQQVPWLSLEGPGRPQAGSGEASWGRHGAMEERAWLRRTFRRGFGRGVGVRGFLSLVESRSTLEGTWGKTVPAVVAFEVVVACLGQTDWRVIPKYSAGWMGLGSKHNLIKSSSVSSSVKLDVMTPNLCCTLSRTE